MAEYRMGYRSQFCFFDPQRLAGENAFKGPNCALPYFTVFSRLVWRVPDARRILT